MIYEGVFVFFSLFFFLFRRFWVIIFFKEVFEKKGEEGKGIENRREVNFGRWLGVI